MMTAIQSSCIAVKGGRVFSCTLPLHPFQKERHRTGQDGKTYTPKRTKKAEQDLAILVKSLKPPTFEGAIELDIVFVIKNDKKEPRTPKTQRPDLSNYVKLVEDALNGVLWKDDAQIFRLSALQLWGEQDQISLSVFERDADYRFSNLP